MSHMSFICALDKAYLGTQYKAGIKKETESDLRIPTCATGITRRFITIILKAFLYILATQMSHMQVRELCLWSSYAQHLNNV